jgi:hypothetical protein
MTQTAALGGRTSPAVTIPPRWRTVPMSFLVWIPLAHLAGGVALAVVGQAKWIMAGAWLLFLPPLAARLAGGGVTPPEGRLDIESPAFLRWWWCSQWQMTFNRLPWIEDAMRLCPGLFSLWLRLWGARIGARTFWGPGVRVLDRPLLAVGNRVVFGAGSCVTSHLLSPASDGRLELILAPVRIGDGVLIGGHAVLGPGTRVADGEAIPSFYLAPPFTFWSGGRRLRSRS